MVIVLIERVVNLIVNGHYDVALGMTLMKCKRSPIKLSVRVGAIILQLQEHPKGNHLDRFQTNFHLSRGHAYRYSILTPLLLVRYGGC